jgi:hypothetical protein
MWEGSPCREAPATGGEVFPAAKEEALVPLAEALNILVSIPMPISVTINNHRAVQPTPPAGVVVVARRGIVIVLPRGKIAIWHLLKAIGEGRGPWREP